MGGGGCPKLEAETKLREAAVTKLQLFCYQSNYGLLPWLLIVDVVGQSPTIMHDLAVVLVYVLSLLPKDFGVLFCCCCFTENLFFLGIADLQYHVCFRCTA